MSSPRASESPPCQEGVSLPLSVTRQALKAITVFFQRWLLKSGVSLGGREGRGGVGGDERPPVGSPALLWRGQSTLTQRCPCPPLF